MQKTLKCGEKIELRPITSDDTENVLKWRNSSIVKPYFIHQEDITIQEHLNWLETKVNTGNVVQFIMFDIETNKPFGSVYLQDIDPVHKKAEYGIFIGEQEYIGKGIGSIIAKYMIEYAFNGLKLHRVYLRVFEDNERAIKSYEHAGFVKEALLHDDVYVNGEYKNIVLMGAVNKED